VVRVKWIVTKRHAFLGVRFARHILPPAMAIDEVGHAAIKAGQLSVRESQTNSFSPCRTGRRGESFACASGT